MVTLLQPCSIPPTETPLFTAGLIADSHVPDRRRALLPGILERFQIEGVDLIYHTGDICSPATVSTLAQIAPVIAVRGNRDWAFRKTIPMLYTENRAGVKIGAAHSHGDWVHYLVDKLKFYVEGYRYERYRDYLLEAFPDAEIILFGHTHVAEIRQEGGRLLINPGSATCVGPTREGPSIGMLKVYSEKRAVVEIIPL